MSNIVLLFVCLCTGIIMGHRRWLPANAHAVLNGFILFVSLPALILLQVHAVRLRPELLYPVAIQNDLNPPLITLMVGFGITLSFLTLPGWWYLLGAV